MVLSPQDLSNGLQVSMHRCPRLMQRELKMLFPGRPASSWVECLAVLTCQHTKADLVDWGPDAAKEKDACLENVSTGVRA